jgi:preprotein translocase subunit SecF
MPPLCDESMLYIRHSLLSFRYLGSLVGSTLLNTLFVKTLKMNKNVAFITTLWTFAAINYFVIGWIIRRADEWEAPKVVMDARKAAKDAQRAVAESKKKEQAKAKMVEAKMKAKAEQAKLKAKALEDRAKAKAELDKQKAKEQAQKEKELAKAKAEKLKEESRKKTTTKVKEVGNKASKNSAKKTISQARGGSVRFRASLDSKELLHSFVLSVGDAVNID